MDNDKIARFWDKFIEISTNYGVAERARRWHVIHAERYIRAHEGTRLSDHTPQQVNTYLDIVSRQSRLADWQFRQVITALQVMFVELVKAPWAAEFPWQEKIDESMSIPKDHATLARDTSQPVATDLAVQTNAVIKADPSSLLAHIGGLFPKHFERLIVEIRMRQYSIRTEKAYTEWLARFIAFQRQQDPATLPLSEIGRYLEHLVINRNVSSSRQSQALNA